MNLKSIVTTAALSAAVGAIALTPSIADATSDYKTYHASGGCKVYGSTQWSQIGFGWQGVNNATNAPVNVICPIITDSDTTWAAASVNAYMHIHARTGGTAASVICAVYSSYANGLTSSDTVNISMVANTTNSSANTAYLTNYSFDDGGVMMLCQLGAYATLAHYTQYEFSATNTP